ncbi:hypothetical protein L2E82_46775 [Cichorium intybus]|uniref:Uncharacterized protein n=1 Tax=Cichorium intybus TaxID=13427 RepID=A0ACB8YUS8_CICIN|nr:hypothetical protein L2E82_46775 [Cichorium intybus]
MFTEKEGDRTKILIVVLEGPKVLREKSSVAPLSYALRQVVQPDDQVVVLVIFNSGDLTHSPVLSSCCINTRTDGRNHQPSARDRNIRILKEEISQETEEYMRLFKPFYRECKNMGVKFTAKLVVGPTLGSIVAEEKNDTGATSVIIGRRFAEDTVPWIIRNDPKFLSSQIDSEDVILYTSNPPGESSGSKCEVYSAEKPSKRYKKKPSSSNEMKPVYCILPNFDGIYQPSSSSTSIASTSEPSQETEHVHIAESNTASSSRSTSHGLEFLVELSWEVISDITDRFKNIINVSSNEAFQMYSGYLEDRSSAIIQSVEEVKLTVFPRKTNMFNLPGFWTIELEISFHDKMNIAIGIAQGLRYMHEQCPRGPIVHGDLRACNILIGHNLEAQITGFGHAKWLQIEQSSDTLSNSCGHKHPSDPNLLEMMKLDVFAFGILLLRLFCNRSAPRHDQNFVKWARPLLEQRAYHILYDESEHDIHGLVIVTTAATRCISTRWKSRPCMSQVLSLLKGESSCAEQTFPSTESTPARALSPDSNVWQPSTESSSIMALTPDSNLWVV